MPAFRMVFRTSVRVLRIPGVVAIATAAALVVAASSLNAGPVVYQYDQAGRLTSVEFDDGTKIGYAIDPAGNRTALSNSLPTSSGNLKFLQASFSQAESGNLGLSVARTGNLTNAVTVAYSVTAGTAIGGGVDYSLSGTLSWAAGDGASKSLTLAITPDTVAEGHETVIVTLGATTGGATLGAPSQATVVILDND